VALHFTREELAERRTRAIALMQKRGLDGLLMFRQESMFYLTGYDTFGYVFFQCLYLGADGRLMLLTRAPDLLQAKHTSVIEDTASGSTAPRHSPRWSCATSSAASVARARRSASSTRPTGSPAATRCASMPRSTASAGSTTPQTWSAACAS
jgi:Xaa-Pro aminopeptidase